MCWRRSPVLKGLTLEWSGAFLLFILVVCVSVCVSVCVDVKEKGSRCYVVAESELVGALALILTLLAGARKKRSISQGAMNQ